MSLSQTKDGVILKVFVKPNAPKFNIKLDGDYIVVCSTEEPEKGKVNKEIIKELTKLMHAKVKLVSGFTSKQKQFFVQNMTKEQAEHLLASA